MRLLNNVENITICVFFFSYFFFTGKFRTMAGGKKLEKACHKYIGNGIRDKLTEESYTLRHWTSSWKTKPNTKYLKNSDMLTSNNN